MCGHHSFVNGSLIYISGTQYEVSFINMSISQYPINSKYLEKYHIYSKYWDILSSYHTCPTICKSLFYYLLMSLTLKAPITTAADNNFFFCCCFFYFFRENKSWHFMWIICLADDSHEMSRLVKKKKKNFECCLLQILLGALRVKILLDERQTV